MSTLIGTGPNGMLAAFMADNYNLDISFVDWMKVGVPLSAVMLPCSWLILTKVIFKVNFETSSETKQLLSSMKDELGSLKGPELKVLIVFFLTAIIIFVGLARIVSQTGLAYGRAPVAAPMFTVNSLGTGVIGPSGLTTLSLSFAWAADIRTFVMAQAATGLKLSEVTRLESRRLLLVLVMLIM